MRLAAIGLMVAGAFVIYFAIHATNADTGAPQPAPGQSGGPF